MLAERDEMLTTAPCPTVSTICRAASFVSVSGAVTLKRERARHEALARVHRGPRHRPAGVVDEDVEPAELLDGAGDEPLAAPPRR